MTTPTPAPAFPVKAPKKLIEVALPLDDINAAAAREKSIRHGHPSTLHLWWARRPLAAARAVIFGQLVNDPSWKWDMDHPGEIPPSHLKASWAAQRKRLFAILSDLVLWENTTNEVVLEKARAEIRKSWRETCELNRDHPDAASLFNPDKLPGLHDPFAGGGAIPLEAQRLGLEAYASDLNPVAVLINKAMIEIPPKFAGRPPVSSFVAGKAATLGAANVPGADNAPATKGKGRKKAASSDQLGLGDAITGAKAMGKTWPGATGLADDVRYYGAWMRNEAEGRIGHLYPDVTVTAEMATARPELKDYAGKELTVIAWLWARTVKSPNPAFSHVDVPLVSSFILSSKPGKESWVEIVIDDAKVTSGDATPWRFEVKTGKPPESANDGTKAPGRGANFRCVMSNAVVDGDYIKQEGQAGRLGAKLMAVVAEGNRSRVYLAPTDDMETVAHSANPAWRPSGDVPARLTGGTCVPYGLKQWGDLFTPRQLVALTTFSDLVGEARERARLDAITAGMPDDGLGLEQGGQGATAYGEAVGVYLAFAVDRLAMTGNSLVRWNGVGEKAQHCFGRQALPMLWDFAEPNFMADATGSLSSAVFYSYDPIASLPTLGAPVVRQADAQGGSGSYLRFFSTDPPYYDNIGYADLSDFFYVWLRKALRRSFPSLLATMAVPKAEELVATPYRHGSKAKAETFFLNGMTDAMRSIARLSHPSAPTTIYYAFKQSETKADKDTSSTGWETFLEAVLHAGFSLTGTWPLRTEMATRQIAMGTNALASSIVLVCRKRPDTAETVSRREFLRELNRILPEALDEMTRGSGDDRSPVAPVDLSQAIIGPGMGVFSKYAAVLEADGTPMSVRTALQLINRFLAEDDFDGDTQFCLHWFDQYAWAEGAYGEADVLARAKATSVTGVADAGVVVSGAGKVRLRKPGEYPADWDPATDTRLPVWEALHQLIRALREGGETEAGRLLGMLKGKTDAIRQLAYRLYTLCERRGLAEDARAYNELVTAWEQVEAKAHAGPDIIPQMDLNL